RVQPENDLSPAGPAEARSDGRVAANMDRGTMRSDGYPSRLSSGATKRGNAQDGPEKTQNSCVIVLLPQLRSKNLQEVGPARLSHPPRRQFFTIFYFLMACGT